MKQIKNLYRTLFGIFLLIATVGNLQAQACADSFTIKTESTESLCQSDGTVTVTLEGNTSDVINIEYKLASDSYITSYQSSNHFVGVPSGTYTLTVKALCIADGNTFQKTSQVKVKGTYKVPEASYMPGDSRQSYDYCATGIIVLEVIGGNGNFTFDIVEAPPGVNIGRVSVSKKDTKYTLAGDNYPGGNYKINVSDGCYTSVATFTFETITELPIVNMRQKPKYKPNATLNCDSLYYRGSPDIFGYDYEQNLQLPVLTKYVNAGMYEIGVGKGDAMPLNWHTLPPKDIKEYMLDIRPYKYSDLYSSGIRLYIRLKKCVKKLSYTSFNIGVPIYYPTFKVDCTSPTHWNTWTFRVYDYDSSLSLYCYPISVVLEDESGVELLNETVSAPSGSTSTIRVPYNPLKKYFVTVTDAQGFVMKSGDRQRTFSRDQEVDSDIFTCKYATLKIVSHSEGCEESVLITIQDSSGKIVWSINSLSSGMTSPQHFFYEAIYGETYSVTFQYPDGTKVRKTIKQDFTYPTGYNVKMSSSLAYKEDAGEVKVNSIGEFPKGTTFSLVGPDSVVFNHKANIASSWFELNGIFPAGEYVLTVDYNCQNKTHTQTFTLPGGYRVERYTKSMKEDCKGLTVTPNFEISYQRKPMDTPGYFKLISGPVGYDRDLYRTGNSVTLTSPGTYVLGVGPSSYSQSLKMDTIVYNPSALALKESGTHAYECTPGNPAVILAEGQYGVTPYTYELWDETATTKLAADIVSDKQIYFSYGSAGDTFLVRVTDLCGNSFQQAVTVQSLVTGSLLETVPLDGACIGSTIDITCKTVGNTTYSWTGPNGFTSSSQNLKFTNVDVSMTGWYTVSLTPQYCGTSVIDSIYVKVHPELTLGDIEFSPDNRQVLQGTVATGSGTYTYQWQLSTDNNTWTDIAGATATDYELPKKPVFRKHYYRIAVTDACSTVCSNAKVIKPRSILINPHLPSSIQNK